MRTKTFRVTAHEMIEKVGQTHADDLISLNFPGRDPKVNVSYPEKGMPAVHAEKMQDPEWILHMARGLDRHIWVVGITDDPTTRCTPRTIPSSAGPTSTTGFGASSAFAILVSSSRSRSTAGTSCSSLNARTSRTGVNTTPGRCG